MMPLIQQNMADATKSQFILLNEQMSKIQHQLTASERNKLFVALPGQKLPRQENILGQYFAKYLNAPIDSKRFIYAEGLTDPASVLTLIGTWQLDSLLAGVFFHDPDRMKRDLLADTAHDYLKHCHADMNFNQALVCTDLHQKIL